MNDKPGRVPTQPTSAPSETDLTAAFSDDADSTGGAKTTDSKNAKKKTKKPLTKLRKISIATLVVGIIALIAGAGYLAYNLLTASNSNDADFLVSVKTWQREDEPSVVWQFTEVGKGVLTTNSGENEYDFTWSFQDGKLKIDTDWLYTLNDEFDYQVDQNAQTLTLTNDDQTITFVPSESENN